MDTPKVHRKYIGRLSAGFRGDSGCRWSEKVTHDLDTSAGGAKHGTGSRSDDGYRVWCPGWKECSGQNCVKRLAFSQLMRLCVCVSSWDITLARSSVQK